jgi:hypothetical protein
VRAQFLKLSLRALERADPALREAAIRLLGEDLQAIRGARALSWMPVSRLLRMSEAAHAQGGPAALEALVLDTMRLALAAPLFNRVVRVAIDSLGLGPPQVARWAPGVYGLAFRGTGTMTVPRVDDDTALVVFRDVPEECLQRPAYVLALGHALSFFFELTRRPGEVRALPREPGSREIAFELRVSPG